MTYENVHHIALGNDDRTLLLLAVGRNSEPLDVLQAQERLRASGISLSESTVARRLRALDDAGLTIQLGKRGRVLTDHGRACALDVLMARRSGSLIRAAMAVHSSEALLNLMRVRRAVEPEAAREAAERVTSADVVALREMLARHDEGLSQGSALPRRIALDFHRRITSFSLNPLLLVATEVALHPSLDRVEATLGVVLERHHVHVASVRAHREIVDACECGDGRRAESLMRQHLDAMIAEVEGLPTEGERGLLNRLLSWSS